MKKTRFFVLLITVLLMSLISSFAEDKAVSGADLLLKYHFIAGDNGDAMVSKPLTRAEVAVIMAELSGEKEAAAKYDQPAGFKDVEASQWYASYIAYGKAKGYLGGYTDGTYRPEAPVTDKEFAAFLMNALGYNGDYIFDGVIAFSADKKVKVQTTGASFVRGDAFEAMWAAVNLPIKGSSVPIGVKMGKLEGSINPEVPVKPEVKGLAYEVKISGAKSFEVTFKEAVVDSNKIKFVTKRMSLNTASNLIEDVSLNVVWNDAKTLAKLSSSANLVEGNYEITVQDAVAGTLVASVPFKIMVEKERIANVKLDSDQIITFNDYLGTVKYTAYNQYEENVTSTILGKNIVMATSTSVSSPEIDYASGVVTIQHGEFPSLTNNLRALPSVVLVMTDPTTGAVFNKNLTVSNALGAIGDVKINGIVNEDGDLVDFVYGPDKIYYLDVTVLDVNGRRITARNALDPLITGGPELLNLQSSYNSVIKITKTTHPKRSMDIAYQISFIAVPPATQSIMFRVIAPTSMSPKNSADLMTTLMLP